MTAKSVLEIEGNFLTHPFAELMVEIGNARLTGSLRVSDTKRKCIVYFKAGRIVFAVSNARSARLFARLLAAGRVTPADLGKIPSFQNDIEFVAFLQDTGFITNADREKIFADQIQAIIVDLLTWSSGKWTFSSLARVRDGLEFEIEIRPLLLDYARTLPVERVLDRFRSMNESFGSVEGVETSDLNLLPHEGFLLSRADHGNVSAADIAKVAGMPEAKALHLIYTLWLAGLLTRHDWQPALPEDVISMMKLARLELKKEARTFGIAVEEPGTAATEISEPAPEPESEPEKAKPLTVEEYLDRVENAGTFYDVLGIDVKATIPEIKQAYFSLAKMFHPDLFHAEGGSVFQRVQHAFTELAQAHETLKVNETRDLYDYRMRKELLARQEQRSADTSGSTGRQASEAADHFKQGFELLSAGKVESAMPFLARAANYAPKTARYRAYYGKALSGDEAQRYRAESEMQAAIKLDPDTAEYRLMLAEFFLQYNLNKRAEGELNRLLAIFPANREAREMLDRIAK